MKPESKLKADSLISNDDIQAFWKHGWIRVNELLNTEQVADILEVWDQAMADPPKYADIYGTSAAVADPIPQSSNEHVKVLGIVREPRVINSKIERIARDTRTGEMVRTLLGAEHARLFSEAFLEKPPKSKGSKETAWHQDLCYEPLDRRSSLNIWAAVEDMTYEQGTIELISGSHRLGPLGRVDLVNPADMVAGLREDDIEFLQSVKHPDDVEGDRGVPITRHSMKAGDALVWQGLTLHHAAANMTDRRRRAYQRMYVSSDVRYTGAPDRRTDGSGLNVGDLFELDRFPIVA